MIISRTPFRISFFGGGTDYPAWYREHGGAVLTATIDKYCYLSVRYLPPFFEHKYRVVYSKVENCQSIDEIAHPAVKGVLNFLKFERGVEIHHDGDLPARSGMGSSSAFTVGLLNAMYGLTGKMISRRQLAGDAIYVEQEVIKEVVGSQDQIEVAYGGLNHITFHPDGDFSVQPITLSRERILELNSYLMLFYTGILRTSGEVAQSYVNDIAEKKRQLRITKDLVKESLSILNSNHDLVGLGELLHESWQIKRSLSNKVSNSDVDGIYQLAKSTGAIGGKLTGAGGGGFMFLFAPPEKHVKIRQALQDYIHVPFKLESSGSQIIFFDPEEDYQGVEKIRAEQKLRNFRELEI